MDQGIKQLKEQNKKLEEQVLKLQKAQIDMDDYNRREILVFDGIPETTGENVETTLKDIFTQMGVSDTHEIKISRCHRLGKSPTGGNGRQHRPIIVKFMWYQDRMKIWEARRNLKDITDHRIFVRENFSAETEKKRAKLYPILRAAKHHKDIKKAFLSKDRLVINGSSYTVDTVHHLPYDLRPENLCERENEDTFVFWAKESMLSNFFPCTFMIDSVTYNCAEQYYCAQKADLFKDHDAYNLIMEERDPAKQKAYAKKVKNFDDDIWKKSMTTVMENGLNAKFQQNPLLLKRLKDTGKKIIGEAAAHDLDWGTGVNLHNKEALNVKLWKGSNLLGKLLMGIRVRHS